MATHDLPISNQELAILILVNDLANRWNIKSREFLSKLVYDDSDNPTEIRLQFSRCPNDVEKKESFFKMLESLGASDRDWEVKGTVDDIFDMLEAAFTRAPKLRTGQSRSG